MPIKFEFTLSDKEAEALFGFIQADINKLNQEIIDVICSDTPTESKDALKNTYKEMIQYDRDLKAKLKNTWVPR